ncbi:MAG: isoprenylcysteine carboxylmethyltransferase family protein [Candidatus Woesebacteria bacterium]|jgi:protein-S-isoprenylcysteine O-methyltransferase Ste14
MNSKYINIVPDLTLVSSLAISGALSLFLPIYKFNFLIINILGWVLIVVSIVIIFRTLALILANSHSSNVSQEPSDLITKGLYAISRNPFYLSYVLLTAGVALVLGCLAAWVGPVICFFVLNFYVIPFEESRLKLQFDKKYIKMYVMCADGCDTIQ